MLQKLYHCRLREGTLWASTQDSPSSTVAAVTPLDLALPLPQLIRSALLRSPLAHLYELHTHFTSLLSLSTTSPSITSAYIPYRRVAGTGQPDQVAFKGLPEGVQIGRVGRAGDGEEEGDVVQLTLACLALVSEEIGAGAL
mgnify:CR=1 FL=1